MNTIKNLSNELKIPIVGAGKREALGVIQVDEQLQNRLRPTVLPRWQKRNKLARLLAALVRSYAMGKLMDVLDVNLREKTVVQSEGRVGEIVGLLEKAAIANGSERISQSLIN